MSFTTFPQMPVNSKLKPASAGGFPVVCLGASAGGLAAFEAFFSGVPSDTPTGMAYVLVQHLAPGHKSMLTELIRRHTAMPVVEVEDRMVIQTDHVYIIPPNRVLGLREGKLVLSARSADAADRLPIDFFFKSVADEHGVHAVGVVLSGTGADGTEGVRAIRAQGGLTLAQTPDSAGFDGMPCSAIATGTVDYTLAPAAMHAHIAAHFGGPLPGAVDDQPSSIEVEGEPARQEVFELLRVHTGHDFSLYKPNTITRRMERRMAHHQVSKLDDYVRLLRGSEAEVKALFDELLIGVTSFFRDPDAFEVLANEVIPRLFEGKLPGEPVRVWTAGCSTGEEGYSIAILLKQHIETLPHAHPVQIFATDLDSRAIVTARAGRFAESIAEALTPDRLARYFSAVSGGGYRIHKEIRDMLIFSEHDVLKDPPFARLDLVTCRNLLIYMGEALQRRLLPLFHYALRPSGFLFLGSSETVGKSSEMFGVIHFKAKIYQRKDEVFGPSRVGFARAFPISMASSQPFKSPDAAHAGAMPPPKKLAEEALLQHFAPASALVNARGDVLYLHGRTGMYLEPAQGDTPTSNVLHMARDGLQHELMGCLREASTKRAIVRRPGLRVKTNGHFTQVDLGIFPVAGRAGGMQGEPLFLVTLAPGATDAPPGAHARDEEDQAATDADSQLATYKLELRHKEDYLTTLNDELTASVQDLKSSNEEMQSMNEEMQSTNEELETSKEEMQSVNEELSTVNTELQSKLADLASVNDDMSNLLRGNGISTIFVDHHIHVIRFTEGATKYINLIPGDAGRPLDHLASNLVDCEDLTLQIQSVLNTLVATEWEVCTKGGRWSMLRIQPYRTLQNVIAGAALTFTDITKSILAREGLRRLATVVNDARDAITVQGLDGQTLAWNPGAERLYGWSEAEALLMNVSARIPPALRSPGAVADPVNGVSSVLAVHTGQRLTKAGFRIDVDIVSTPLVREDGSVYAIATTERRRR